MSVYISDIDTAKLYIQSFTVFYSCFSSLSISHSSNGALQGWSSLELVAYESGRKESFECSLNQCHIYG